MTLPLPCMSYITSYAWVLARPAVLINCAYMQFLYWFYKYPCKNVYIVCIKTQWNVIYKDTLPTPCAFPYSRRNNMMKMSIKHTTILQYYFENSLLMLEGNFETNVQKICMLGKLIPIYSFQYHSIGSWPKKSGQILFIFVQTRCTCCWLASI